MRFRVGQLGEWPAQYLHERNTDMLKFSRDPVTGEIVSELLKNPPKSSLHIGEWGAWNADVTGIAGDFALGIFPPGFIRTEQLPTLSLAEGTPREVLLTSYERNEEARRLCIKYYGASHAYNNDSFQPYTLIHFSLILNKHPDTPENCLDFRHLGHVELFGCFFSQHCP